MGRITKVETTWFGRLLSKLTFGLWRPSVTFSRAVDANKGDFLYIGPGVNCTIIGPIIGHRSSAMEAVRSGNWSDPGVWKLS